MSAEEKAEAVKELAGRHEEAMLALEEGERSAADVQGALQELDDVWQQLGALEAPQPPEGAPQPPEGAPQPPEGGEPSGRKAGATATPPSGGLGAAGLGAAGLGAEIEAAIASVESDIQKLRLEILAKAREENPGSEVYVPRDGRPIVYETASSKLEGLLEAPLPPLDKDKGEWCFTETQFVREGFAGFTAGNGGRVETADDVAYMFRKLESAQDESIFAVLVKGGESVVLHLGTGAKSAATCNFDTLRAGVDRVAPDEVYFVHNHPSGTMLPSREDCMLLDKMRNLAPATEVHALIIDTWKREYCEFGDETRVHQRVDVGGEQVPVSTWKMAMAPWNMDYKPEKAIISSEAAAGLIANRRLAATGKVGYILFDRAGKPVANICSVYDSLDAATEAVLAQEMISNSVRFAGSAVIMYGSDASVKDWRALRNIKERLQKADVRLNDSIYIKGRAEDFEGMFYQYDSASDNGIMEPGERYGKGSDDISFRLGDPAETFDARRQAAVANRGTVMPDLNQAEVKVVDVPRHEYQGHDVLTQAVDAASKRYKGRIIQYGNNGQQFEYTINPKDLKYAANHAKNSTNIGVHAAVMDKLDSVIGESIEEMEHADVHKVDNKRSEDYGYNTDALMHRFVGAVNIDGKIYRVITTLKEKKGGNSSHHTYEVTKIEVPDVDTPSTSNATTTVGLPTVEVAKLLNGCEIHNKSGEKILDESKKADEGANPSTAEGKRAAAQAMGETLHNGITVVDDASETADWVEADEATRKRMAKAPGWYNHRTGEVVVVVKNNRDAEDVAHTVLHEVVAHKGIDEPKYQMADVIEGSVGLRPA